MEVSVGGRKCGGHIAYSYLAIEHSFRKAAISFVDLLYGACVADIDLVWRDSYNRAYFNIREGVAFFLKKRNNTNYLQHIPYFS